MPDFVYPEDRGTGVPDLTNTDWDDAANDAALSMASNVADYVESGLGITADFTAEEIDVARGMARVRDDSADAGDTEVQRDDPAQVVYNQPRDQGVLYAVIVEARTGLAFSSSTERNWVHLVPDLSQGDTVNVVVESGAEPTAQTEPALLVACVDPDSQEVWELNRTPSAENASTATSQHVKPGEEVHIPADHSQVVSAPFEVDGFMEVDGSFEVL